MVLTKVWSFHALSPANNYYLQTDIKTLFSKYTKRQEMPTAQTAKLCNLVRHKDQGYFLIQLVFSDSEFMFQYLLLMLITHTSFHCNLLEIVHSTKSETQTNQLVTPLYHLPISLVGDIMRRC